jgi:phage FluMu gp28-like protein
MAGAIQKIRKVGKALVAAGVMALPQANTATTQDFALKQPIIELLTYQRTYLADQSRFKLAWWARGTRKTFTTTLEIVNDVLQVEAQGKRTRWIIASRGERQALVAIEFAKQHSAAFALGIADVLSEERDLTDEHGRAIRDESGFVTKYKVHTIRYPNGSEIIAVPALADTLRGFTGNLLLDEFAFHQDSRAIWKAVFPIIRAEYKLRIASTGNGKSNKFYELATITDPVWSIHKVTIVDAVADGLPFNVDEQRRALNDEDAWAQEYMLEWLDEASAWLDYDLINSCEHEHAGDPNRYGGGLCYSGEDIGLRSDLWVMWIKEVVGDVLWTREIRTLRRAKFLEQDRTRDELFGKYRILRHCIDQTGMGEKPVEDAKRRHGDLRVEGVLFTGPSKLLLATTFKQSFQDRKIRIPQGDDVLRADLHKIKKEATQTGAARFIADRDSTGHADRFWAGALATYAASGVPMAYDWQSIEEDNTDDDDDDRRWERFPNPARHANPNEAAR